MKLPLMTSVVACAVFGLMPVSASEPVAASQVRTIGKCEWHTDYVAAYRAALAERKQLLLYFYDPQHPQVRESFEKNVLAHPDLHKPLTKVVCAILPYNVAAPGSDTVSAEKSTGSAETAKKQPKRLLDHHAFEHMRNKPGLAVIDLVDKKDTFHGKVVSAHPFNPGTTYTLPTTRIVLGLPRATITQRTLVFAVRTHPEAPLSTQGLGNPVLFQQAAHHSALMAQYGAVGHHDWGTRSNQISATLGNSPVEVAGTSWGGGNLIDAANEVVAQWRGSSTHWWMVSASQGRYGYDMVRTPGGQWYATGIFLGQ